MPSSPSVQDLLKGLINSPAAFTPDHVASLVRLIMDGEASQAQIGAFLISLKTSGKENDPAVIASVARVMRSFSVDFPIPTESLLTKEVVVDIVGTGGDGQDTFNVSTASSIIASGCGTSLSENLWKKHGNRASSSSCGSADVLEALGCALKDLPVDAMPALLERNRFCFLFAQVFHPAMRHVAGPRKEIGVRTIFNLLGPLTNPAKPGRAVIGVHSKNLGRLMAEALLILRMERAWVVNGDIGLDEISPVGMTTVWSIENGAITEMTISPADFGLSEHPISSVAGGDAPHNADLMMQLLSGTLDGPILDFVLMNCAALLLVAGKATDLKNGVELARQSIASGKAKAALLEFAAATQKIKSA
ncbi:glycosyl transferase family, a/b domain-containing protein [Chytridium lagenaria]|nr:glycosyl transferase family, a/b domain-containing protein [Chytridium lagenaria]